MARLTQAVRFSSHVKPICLPKQDVRVGKPCVIAGWGVENYVSGESTVERQVLIGYNISPF